MRQRFVHQMFSDAAEIYDDHTAIQREAGRISYGELESKANRLANYLIANGARKGSIVALLARDTFEVVASIIGSLKAGCVFVPMDPAIPEARLRAMVSLASPQWFIVESIFVDTLNRVVGPSAARPGVILLGDQAGAARVDRERCSLAEYDRFSDSRKCEVESAPDDMCYIFFTSGSTGQPKGIAGRLRGIDHFVRWEIKTFAISEGARVSQLTTPSFDAYLRDIFVPLCAGGTVCSPGDRETVLDARKLVRWIDDQRIDLIHCVPSLFRSILSQELSDELFKELRYILMAGEPLLPSDVKRWMDVFGERVQLVNLYGPTETTMTKFFYFVQSADRERRSIPIGKPMEGARALVVDAKGKTCSVGAIGEIYIRTPYMTLGYHNQPELTGQVFVQNPFNDDPRDIVYKTGDYGRILKDGNFEFLGRRDHQVKIRGVRVELREIEDLLLNHPSITDAAVVDREDLRSNKYLCAYVVMKDETETGKLGEYLNESLPDFMIPSAFYRMEKLPRTISGKVDRKALPVPGQSRAGMSQGYVAPRTPTEEVLAAIWSQVLGLEQIGIHDNFFELGGHSLLATQVLSRVREPLQVELPLRFIFEAPTIAGLGARIESLRQAELGAVMTPITPIPRTERLPLSSAQQRLWFLHKLEPDNSAFNVYAAARFLGKLNLQALERALEELVRRHEILRTSYTMIGEDPVQVISPPQKLDALLVDLTLCDPQEGEERAKALASEDVAMPFDLARSPICRVLVFKLGEEDHVVHFSLHHIAFDAWSRAVLTREVAILYNAFSRDEPTPLPEMRIQYADFAGWQKKRLEQVTESQLAYWKSQLSGMARLNLPTDRARPAIQSFGGANREISLPNKLSQDVIAMSRQEGVTVFMTLLSVFSILLQRHAAQDDVVIGSDIAYRTQVETEDLIGFFVNQLVLRINLGGNPTFRELVKRVRDITLGAYSHQDLPFEKIVESLNPARDLSHHPLFQVKLVYQNVPESGFELPGITILPFTVAEATSKLDLVMFFWKTSRGISGRLEYSTELFEPSTVDRMLMHFTTLLEHAVEHPDSRIGNLEMLTPEEAQQQTEERMRILETDRQKLLGIRRVGAKPQ